MPIDTVKTRMQSIEARSLYKNSFDCAAKIFKNEGILVFWSGALPRLGRLILSGGIVFTMYGPQPDPLRPLNDVANSSWQVRKDDGSTGQV